MGADFGLYTGLLRKSNIFETKAQNRQMELQIAASMEQRSKQKLQEQADIDAKMQEYFNAVNELDILEQDKERVQSADDRYRMDVINGIKQYNGDLSAFMLTGGSGVLSQYQRNLMESEEVTNAISNKTNYAQWMHAQANGLFVKDVGVDVDVVNPDGTVTKERRKVSMDEAYGMFEKNQINQIPFDGAEQDIDVGPEIFQTLYKDPRDPYRQDTEVNPNDVYLWVKEHGGSEDQAIHKMNKYIQYRDQGGTEWRYKSGDMLDKKIKEEQLRGMRQNRALQARAAQSQEQAIKDLTPWDVTHRVQTLTPGTDTPILPKEVDFYMKKFNISKNDDGSFNVPAGISLLDMEHPDPKATRFTMDSGIFNELTPIGYSVGADGKKYLKFSAKYSDEGQEGLPAYEGMMGWDYFATDEGMNVNNFKQVEDDIYEGSVYLPIDDLINDPTFKADINNHVGLTYRDMNAVPYMPSQYEQTYSDAVMQQTIQAYLDQGVPMEQIQQFIYQMTQESSGGPPAGGTQAVLDYQNK